MIPGAIWNGFIMGLGLSFSFGPVFFLLLDTSIKKGWRESLIFDAGVLLSDLLIILFAMLLIFIMGININFENNKVQLWSTIFGVAILLAFGMALLLRPHKDTTPEESRAELLSVRNLSDTGLFFRGLWVNLINPSVFLIWFAAVPAVAGGYKGDMKLVSIFFLSTLVFYFLVDLAKIYAARKLKRFLTPLALTLFHRVSGIIFVGIALWLLYRYFFSSP